MAGLDELLLRALELGHLAAQGKRVLVTSHTTKALRVLRDQVVETLQPLCVAVLDSDAESRSQMEQSVRGILSRLTASREDELAREAAGLEEARGRVNEEIAQITRDLRVVREAEYQPIVLAGEAIDPVQAAREVSLRVPLVVRLEGTNVGIGRKILAESGLPIITGANMAEAAQKVVAAARSK